MISTRYLKKHGFVKLSEGWEFKIAQYGGYSDYIYIQPDKKRLVVQCNNGHSMLEVMDCESVTRLKECLKVLRCDLK